jgi:hypothetical protein
MNRQLHLLPHDHGTYRRISDETKAVGRRGIAQARAALLAARTGRDRPPQPIARPSSHSHSRVRAQQRKTAA